MGTTSASEYAKRIADLNDRFRRSFVGGSVYVTAGVQALPLGVRAKALREVVTFTDFTPENDPYGEHDFGAFEVAGHTFFWKIDCYDQSMLFGSDDPANPAITRRVLTVMLAEEY